MQFALNRSPLKAGAFKSSRNAVRAGRRLTPVMASNELVSRLQKSVDDEDFLGSVEIMMEAKLTKAIDTLDPNVIANVVDLCSKEEQHKKAQEYIDILVARGEKTVPPYALDKILLAYLRESAPNKAGLALVDRIIFAGVPVDDRIKNKIARLAAKCDNPDRAFAILEELERLEQHIDVQTFDAVVMSCLRASKAEMAEQVMEMREYHLS